MLTKRICLDYDKRIRIEKAIQDHIVRSTIFLRAKTVALYMPIRGEADVLPLLIASEKKIVFPKVNDNMLIFCPAKSIDECCPGCYGIPEPSSPPVRVDEIDLVVVPGVVFDHFGYRIGYGKGFYDRLIMKHPKMNTMGVCFDDFFVDRLPRDPWDVNVDSVVTQTGIFHSKREVK